MGVLNIKCPLCEKEGHKEFEKFVQDRVNSFIEVVFKCDKCGSKITYEVKDNELTKKLVDSIANPFEDMEPISRKLPPPRR